MIGEHQSCDESTAARVDAEALSSLPPNCFQSLTREGSHLLLLVAEIQSAKNCHCKTHLSPGYLLALTASFGCLSLISDAYLLARCAHL